MKKVSITLLTLMIAFSGFGQISAKLMQMSDVSDTQIAFVYGGDIWVVPKAGGTAIQVTNSPGAESWPKFSPDGSLIAYTANYHGNLDVYVMPTKGGLPTRITYNSFADRTVDWHPDGERVLFASRREMGQRSSRHFYLVSKEGGFPTKLSVPYGELASFSPDGNKLAYTTKITENYPFKRYRGGLASDVIIFDLQSNSAENITNNTANDGKPSWADSEIFFLSDQGENMRLNVWVYNTESKSTTQITSFTDFDVSYMSAGSGDLVFEAGGVLYLMDISTRQYNPVDVNVISDLAVEIPAKKNVSNAIRSMTASPKGKRIVFEARGELFNVPVKEGYTQNLTRSSGAFDRDPAWSPDGKQIAYWSDQSGEWEIYLQEVSGSASPRKLSNYNGGFGYRLYWSPDNKWLAFINEKNEINVVNASTGETTPVRKDMWNRSHPGRLGYPINWSPDSKWLAFHQGLENSHDAVFIYSLADKSTNQITSGFFDDFGPVFSADGKYIFYRTNRTHSANYSDVDNTWIYPNATQIAAVALTAEAPYLLSAKNDALEEEKEEEPGEEDDKKKKKDKDKGEEKKENGIDVKIDFDNIESRLVLLPPKAGNMGTVIAFKDKIVYHRFPNTGSVDEKASLQVYDLKEREEKTVLKDVRWVVATADGESLLVRSGSKYGIIKPSADQKIKDPIPTGDLVMDLVPKEEWRQLFTDAWRRHRDFFYDPNMHGLNWQEMRTRYGALIEDARTRWDVTNIISNMSAELSAGHTYTFGGDVEQVKTLSTGFLGIDWDLNNNVHRIKRIVKPAEWDMEVRSPFDRPGSKIKTGDYILAVNGIGLDPDKDPYAAFEGLSGKTVSLNVSPTGSKADASDHIVKCLTPSEERQLRYQEWIENNRKMVDELSDGQLGYVYMSNTAGQGQKELIKMFYGQLHKKGFIIDERFNGGGQLADRFLELMKRPVVYNLHWRHGKDHTWPIKTNTGPLGMLINGWAGSGGDGLPWAFQELEAGPIVGERTLGILVGPATGHRLIDGGGITVPGGRLYDNDGHWFWEGEGVTPDFPVWDDPNILVQGRDPQMEKVVEEVLKLLEENPPQMTPAPEPEDRTATGLKNRN